MDDEKQGVFCELCKCNVSGDKNLEEHYAGKRHQLALHNSHIIQVKEKSSVFITGFPNMVAKEKIIEFLSTYGSIVDTYIGERNKFVIVQFKEDKVAEHLLNMKLQFYGKNLNVKPRKARNQQEISFVGNDTFDDLLESLRDITDFDQQINYLLNYLQPPKHERIPKYIQLCEELQAALRPFFTNSCVYPFGSTVTGLDFKNSDVDAYVHVPIPLQLDGEEPLATAYVNNAKKLLSKHPSFKNVVSIPKAKTPIVKCVYKPTNISCDLNFKNMLGVCNSKLIIYYKNLDPKLRKIMIIIKIWAKMHDFIGSGGKMSCYSLILMFIFYMQQSPYFFPTVYRLQENIQPNLQEGWNGSFNDKLNYTSSSLNVATIPEILYGFFRYYETFDYGLHIVAPYVGRPLLKLDFMNVNTVDEEYVLYKINLSFGKAKDPIKAETPLCLQDPFEQNHNTTRGLSMRCLEEFIATCKHSAGLLKTKSTEQFSLYRLLSEDGGDTKYKGSDTFCEFKISMGTSLSYLECNISEDSVDKSKELQFAWYESVQQFLLELLVNVFKCTVTIKKELPTNSKFIKLEGQDDVYQDIVETVQFHCLCNYNLWETRKAVMRDLTFENNVLTNLKKHICVTDYICDVLLKDVKPTKPILDFYLTLNALVNPIRTEFILRRNNDKQEFKKFAEYLALKFSQWYEIHEKELNQQRKTNVVTETGV